MSLASARHILVDSEEECLNGCDNCQIINPEMYGSCPVDLGWAFTGNDCENVEGCGYGSDEGWFYDSYGDCMTRCFYNWGDLSNESVEIPSTFNINAYPNPFNPTTNIIYDVPNYSRVSVQIFNMNGQLINELINEIKTPGIYTVSWNASNATSGTYIVKMIAGSFVKTMKVSVIK